MSYPEILAEVQSWPPGERQKLAEDLKLMEAVNDPAYLAGITQSLDESLAGRNFTREQVLAHLARRGVRLS